ncbi:MAG: hypothetical protein HY562_01470 [Ignavibacteriales bacterium]|nr:hypothetical protein [Ignavibacteriales bacterium]
MNNVRYILLLLSVSAPAASFVYSLPKFASRTGAKCQSCHVNPTGKGMRSEFGSTYGRDDITMPTFKEQTDYDEFSTNLTSNISVGADVRTLVFYNQREKGSSFFEMQGDLYFDLRLNKKLRVYFDKGLYTGFELMAIAKVLPMEGYVKVGKFMPAYGTRIDDHNAFIRGGPFGGGPYAGLIPADYPDGLRFGERSEDTGIEFGFTPSFFSFQLGFFNGLPGAGINGFVATKQKAVALRAETSFRLREFNISLGGSLYNYPDPTGTITYYGAFGSVTLLETLTFHTEVDILTRVQSGPDITGMILWNELNYMVVPGIDLKFGYEFYDPDTEIKNGSFSRITLGAEFFPLSGLEVRPLYKINLEDLPSGSNVGNDEFQLMFHLFL